MGGTRKSRENNNAFSFRQNDTKIRVCETFFNNTLDLNYRSIRTVQQKRNEVGNTLADEDHRGKQKAKNNRSCYKRR